MLLRYSDVFCVSCEVLFVEVQFNTVQNEKGHQAQDVNVVVPPDQASYFGEIKSFNPMKGRLDGHEIIFLCVFFLFNLQLGPWTSRCLGSLELQFFLRNTDLPFTDKSGNQLMKIAVG